MFRIERQQEILNYVNEHQTAKNQEMARYFHTCLATIRNDINELALRGLLVMTHGGAVCLQHSSNKEIPSIVRFQQNIESKQAIASIAANMVEDGDVIILDSGSTTHEIATRLKASNVTVVTNDLRIALTLAEQGNANVIVAGGTLMASVYTLVGSETIDFLKNIKVHKLFLGCDAIDFNSGITNRTFDDVLDCASFAVYREGFKTGFGADGDHLKTASEVEYALSRHYTMITLDCSEHIHGEINDENCDALYTSMPELEAIYLDRSFDIGEGCTVHFDAHEFHKTALIYAEAVQFAAKIYHDLIESPEGDRADFEMSIDETATPTTPAQHFFVANEFRRLGVHTCTVAPRFCGEFQKGIDYKGDLKQFEAELKVHAAIARHFGYKLSIHSGSDKFSVFPYIGRETQGRFHLKTAGTNWLQAMLLIADCEPELYREVHAYALTVFNEATKYYHVTTDLNRIPALDSLTDAQLPELFKNEDSRQLIHITYGLILNAKDEDGKFRFRDRLFEAWRAHEETLSAHVATHIERHMKLILGEEV